MCAEMKKKKEITATDSNPSLNLKSVIHQHSIFFNKLIELIPAKFYLPIDDKERPWFQGLSEAEKASAKKETKENIKKARRDRFDPEKSSTTTLDLLNQSLEMEKSKDESDKDEAEAKPTFVDVEGDDRSVTYEELRQRLHKKIEEFRASRKTGGSERDKKRNEKKERATHLKKRKRDPGNDDTIPATRNSVERAEKDAAEAARELTFSHIKLGNEEHGNKRKLSKLKELEKAKQLEEAKKDPEKGEIISKKHSWKAATSRAAGFKVHDDPKLLKHSIKKEKKHHQKSVEKWKERIETTEKRKGERQQKRSGNIAQRIHDKKMLRIVKREKKLMRPGFEGRKEGFITEGSSQG